MKNKRREKMSTLSKEKMSNAYKEVYEILKNLGEENSIPVELLNLIKNKMNKDYQFQYDPTKGIEDIIMLEETRAILGYIYLNYWADDDDKKNIENIMKDDLKKCEENH